MKNSSVKRFFGFVGKAAFAVLSTATFTVLFCGIAFFVYTKTAPGLSVDEFYTMAKSQDRTTKLYYISYSDGDGRSEVARELEGEALYGEQNRDWVKYTEIPENLKNAFIAIEDHRFFKHKGVDLKRTAGAIMGYVSGKTGYGGSTITQQLIKNVTGDDDYSVNRKIKEIIKAYKLDAMLTKEEILELYLNTIYLSEKSYGVGTAAQTYFGKDASELSLVESASLACIPQFPSKWNPINNPENNKKRRNTVISRMEELGMISSTEAEAAKDTELVLNTSVKRENKGNKIYSWYTESVIEESIRLLTENRIAANRQTATKMIYTGGLNIITAQNPKMQSAVERYFSISSNFYTSNGETHPECSIVVMNKNGNILALAGATGKKESNRGLNFATETLRSPGSAIKPLSVYAPGIDKGIITYGSVIDDTPVKFVPTSVGYRGWPQNYPVGYRGLTTVRDAVARSVNTVAVKTLEMLGTEGSFKLLHDDMRMKHLVYSAEKNGKRYTDNAVCPLALGQLTDGVTVSELTAGYTALCNEGVFSEGRTVLKILDSEGNLLIDNTSGGKRIFSTETASIMTRLLQGVTVSGTAQAMKMKNTVECAGKTGTTNNDFDRWYVGYTPDIIAGVWFGYPNPESLEHYPTSPSPALKAWDGVMRIINTEEYLGKVPTKKFKDADGVVTATYCRDSGKLLSAACGCDPRGSRVETGYFTKETLPSEYCDCHTLVSYDIVNGGVACPHCPKENCIRVALLNVRRSFPHDVIIADAEYTWQALSEGTPPCLLSNEPFYLYELEGGFSPGHSARSVPFNRYCYSCYLENMQNDEEYYGDSPENTEFED